MARVATAPSPLDDIQLVPPQTPDRLPAMLFLAALFHGILIIGVTFNAELLDDLNRVITLDVTIVAEPDQAIDRPDEAAYLAQASQRGGGNTTEHLRPTAPLQSRSPVDNLGDESGEHFVDTRIHERAADQLIATQADRDRRIVEDLRDDPQTEQQTAVALESGVERTLPLPQDDNATLLIHDDDPREVVVSVDTRDSVIAPYLQKWKGHVESVGAAHFPDRAAIEGHAGRPTVEVAIAPSGHLNRAIIRKSSGSPLLDRAALDILRRAAPYEPLPDNVGSIRFAYDFVFGELPVPSTARLD